MERPRARVTQRATRAAEGRHPRIGECLPLFTYAPDCRFRRYFDPVAALRVG